VAGTEAVRGHGAAGEAGRGVALAPARDAGKWIGEGIGDFKAAGAAIAASKSGA
jgi:hypothetical protein